MKWIFCPVLFLCLASILSLPVKADYNQAYADYQTAYSNYRVSYDNYTVARATYFTYRTLTTRNDALEKMRAVLSDRDDTVIAYLTLLKEKTRIGDGIPVNQADSFIRLANTQISWLSSNKRLVTASSTIEDLNTQSQDFDDQYGKIIKDQTSKMVATILLSKVDYAYAKMPDIFSRAQLQLGRLPSVGEDNLTQLRGLDVAQSKAKLWESKRAEVLSVINPPAYSNSREFSIGNVQNVLFEGLQYLKESTSYLGEIFGALTRSI